MPKFFIKSEQVNEDKVIILGDDVNHIKNVLRLKEGNQIVACNINTEINYTCEIEKINEDNIKCNIVKEIIGTTESNIYINIFQGLPKSDKMELIIQKSVEVGVCVITPVEMERCVVKLDDKAKIKKQERWQKIAEAAAKQSGRDVLPKVNDVIKLKNICNLIHDYDIVLVAYENENNITLKDELKKIKNLKKNLKIGLVIGPEGGFCTQEIEILKSADAKIVTLGSRILRTETVAIVVSGIIMYELET